MSIKTLFENGEICLEEIQNESSRHFRITLFNKDNHWDGDLTFNHNGVLADDISDTMSV